MPLFRYVWVFRRVCLLSVIVVMLGIGVRAMQPSGSIPAAANPLYWTPDFQAEYREAIRGAISPTGLAVGRDMAGRYITIRDGYRVVLYQPATYERTVWLFGNSTLVAPEMPDAFTAATLLQALRQDVRVHNRAVVSITSRNQIAYVRAADIKPGDTVIVYDGYPDARYSVPTDEYTANERALAAYVQTTGATYWHIFQPNVVAEYEALYATYREALAGEAWSLDWTALLDGLGDDDRLFFTGTAHMADIGQMVLAYRFAVLIGKWTPSNESGEFSFRKDKTNVQP